MYHGERFNAWTHLVGALLAGIGAVWLLVLAALDGSTTKIVSVAIYGVTLVMLSISTVYHSVRGRAKVIMRKLDHLSIYLLIAGSYTPFCLVTLEGAWGWTLFGIVWTLGIIGMLQEIKPRSEARVLSIIIYAVMGWIVLIALKPLIAALGTTGFTWLAAGGCSTPLASSSSPSTAASATGTASAPVRHRREPAALRGDSTIRNITAGNHPSATLWERSHRICVR